MMYTVANQKTIIVNKQNCDRENPYALFNINALQTAMQVLKGEAFKLWVYINKNREGHRIALSAVDALSWGIGSKSSYNRAVKTLLENGYLVKVGKNLYNYYEMPQNEYRNNK